MLRLRLPELLKGRTAYALAKASGGKISMSTAHRLVQRRGNVKMFDRDILDALCDILDVEPGELLERDTARRRASRR